MTESSVHNKARSICLVHDWLVTMRGGEKVLEALTELFPEAPIYTLFVNKKRLSPLLQSRVIHASFLQAIPGISRFYRWLLPLFPFAIRSLNVRRFDIVISSSHCVSKAIRCRQDAVHICYCHTPMRYLWGFEEEYFSRFPKWLKTLMNLYFNYLKKWDIATSKNVNIFIANSTNTANKIKNLYGKDAVVIHPPVASQIDRGEFTNKDKNYYLIVSALVPYKKIDIAIQAFTEMKLPLKIIGEGPEKSKLQNLITHSEIEMIGWVENEQLWEHYANCRALIFPGEEDFGMVPVEAQMMGKPVLAYGKGGILDTVIPYQSDGTEYTGLFFYDQTVQALRNCIEQSKLIHFDSQMIKRHAQKFDGSHFNQSIKRVLSSVNLL